MSIVPPPPRKTLLEWIETDDGDTPSDIRPTCSDAQRVLHAAIAVGPVTGSREPLTPPAGLALAPLG